MHYLIELRSLSRCAGQAYSVLPCLVHDAFIAIPSSAGGCKMYALANSLEAKLCAITPSRQAMD
jgi:hypothetical protein